MAQGQRTKDQLALSARHRPVRLAEAVPAVGDRERAVLLRRHLEVKGGAVVLYGR